MQKFKLTALTTLLVVLLSACQNIPENESDSELNIYATVYPLEYIVEKIGQNTVEVSSVFPPGVDGHSYEPTMQEMTQYADGDAFFYIGGIMEAFSDSIANVLSGEDVELVGLSEHEALFQRDSHEDNGTHETGTVTIEGMEDHYHTGDTISLTAVYDNGTDHFHWYTRESEDDEWTEVAGQYHDEFEIDADDEIGQVKAEQFDEDHEVLTESEPVDIVIDDHDGEHSHEEETAAAEETITIEGLAGHYHTGELVELTVSTDQNYSDIQWCTMSSGSDEWEPSDQTGETFEEEAAEDLEQVKVELLDEEENIIVESEPVEIIIDDHDETDPHIWIDPLKMIEVAEIVTDEMIAMNPEEEELYLDNLETLKIDMEELDQEFNDRLNDGNQKHIIVPHAAFGYWDKYGVEQIPITGYTMTDEPSQNQLTELVQTINEHDLEYVLYEQNSTNNISEVIQSEIEAEAEMIHNMEVRTEKDINDGDDYISLMRKNLEVLEKVTE